MLLAEERTHVLVYEWGGPAIHSGLVMRGLVARGRPRHAGADRREVDELGPGSVVVLENTHRSSGGRIWPLDEFRAVGRRRARARRRRPPRRRAALQRLGRRRRSRRRHGRALADSVHDLLLEGARLPARRGRRRLRRADRARLGEQVPLRRRDAPGRAIAAAAMLYALDHNVERLADDHARARRLAEGIGLDPATSRRTSSRSSTSPATGIERLRERGVLVGDLRPGWLRAVTHLDVTRRRHRARDRAHPRGARSVRVQRLSARRRARAARPRASSATSACRASRPPSSATASSIWETAVGAADVEAEREATPDTQYRIGSITKTFTAAAIMQLRDAGKLDLEDTLDRHVEGAAHAPTLRRLLSHTLRACSARRTTTRG